MNKDWCCYESESQQPSAALQHCRDAPAATLGPAGRGLVRGAAGTLSPISLLTEETMNDDR